MATSNKVFQVQTGATGNLTLAGTSANVSIAAHVTKSEDAIRLVSDVDCWVRFTNGSGTAVTTDIKVIANTPEAFALQPDVTHLNAIAGGAGVLNWAVGKGA